MADIYKIQVRRGTAAQWAAANPVLDPGTPGFELDTGVLKVGDGVTAWNDLDGIGGDVDLSDYMTAEDTKAYADDGDRETLVDAQTYTDDQLTPIRDEIDQLRVTDADNALDLQDQISTVVSGLKHGAPVDSLTNDPPAAPREDAYYIVGTVPTGAFVGHADAIATFDPKTKWSYEVPESGEARLVEDQNQIYAWNGTKWVKVGSVASKGDTDIHSFPEVVKLNGGDEMPLADVTDKFAKKKIQVINLREDITTYMSDKSMNLLNKGLDLSQNSVRGTVDEFNAAVTDGDFVTDTDLAAYMTAEDAKAYADDGDRDTLTDAQTYADAQDDLIKQTLVTLADADDTLTAQLAAAVLGLEHEVAVLDILAAPPAAPDEGDLYIVGAAPTGVFAGHVDELAEFTGGVWTFDLPNPKETHLNEADNQLWNWNGTAWVKVGTVAPSLDIDAIKEGIRDEFDDKIDTRAYIDAQDAQTLDAAESYTDSELTQTTNDLVQQLQDAHDDLRSLVFDHVLPAATVAAAAPFDPNILTPIRQELSNLKLADATLQSDLGKKIDAAVAGLAHDVAVAGILAAPPTTSPDDVVYIVDPTPTGAFVGHANQIAVKTSGVWAFSTPAAKETHLNEADGSLYTWNGTVWVKVAAASGNNVAGSLAGTPGALTLWTGTKAQYDAITTKDPNTIYVIV